MAKALQRLSQSIGGEKAEVQCGSPDEEPTQAGQARRSHYL